MKYLSKRTIAPSCGLKSKVVYATIGRLCSGKTLTVLDGTHYVVLKYQYEVKIA